MKELVGGIQIGYDESGNGDPLLLIHGFPHSRQLWKPQLTALSHRFRCIAPDLRGFGESSAEAPFTMDRYADDMAGLLDSLGIARCAVGGLSMGGYIAFAMWRRHRARISSLILADTRADADSEEGREKRKKMIAMARDRGSKAVADAMMGVMVGATTRRERPDVLRSVRAMLEAAPVDGIVGALEAMMHRPDSTPILSAIDVPVTVIVGEEDEVTPPDIARRMAEAIPGSRLEIIPAAGHVSNVEQPELFAKAVTGAES